jgi:tetratricopeptide (TPR) repeat protein
MQLPAELINQPIDRKLIELLKTKVDFCIRSDAGQALEIADLAVSLSSEIQDPLASAIALRSKASATYSVGRYSESVALWEKALDLYSSAGNVADVAAVQRSMVAPLMYLGKYNDALDIAGRARKTLIALDDTAGLARLDTNIGNVYHRLDRNTEALEYYERAQAAFRRTGETFGIALTSFNAANIHSNLHNFESARNGYQFAEDLYREKDMSLAAARARYSLGYLEFLTGNYHRAMRTLYEVKPELERLGDLRTAALCLLDLAEICVQMNVLDEAASLAQQAREQFHDFSMRYEEAKALMFRGVACLGLGHLDDSDRLLADANRLFTLDGNSLYMGLTAAFAAELELRRGRPEEALVAVANAHSIFDRQDLGAKQCHVRLIEARALKAARHADAAMQNCLKILETLKRTEALWLESEVRELMADLFLDSGKRESAYAYYLSAVDSIEQRRANIRVDEFRSAFMGDKLRVYEKLIGLCLEQNSPAENERAFYYLESRKARTLVDMLTNDLDFWPEVLSSDSGLRREWQILREELHWLHARIHQSQGNTNNRTVAVELDLQSEIRAKERALAELARRAQVHDPHFNSLEGECGLTADELRKALSEEDTLIEYYADAGNLMAFVVDQRSIDVVRLPGTLADIREQAMEMKFLIEKFQYGPAYISAHQGSLLECVNASLKAFHHVLFAPLAERVAGRKLVIVPFDVLHNVPFHCLFNGSRYVIEDHEVAYAPSARLYALCRSRGVSERSRISVFGIADSAAPHIEEEVATIQGYFPAASCFTGEAASSRTLAAAAASSDVVHIASHAVFRHDNPMFSAFKLSDEWLNAYDVCQLRMNSAMVTLSGCSTGAGRVYAGDEMLGLVRAFLKAGASSLVVSLWAVNDRSSASLMAEFYKAIGQGGSARNSLREAILKLKADYPNPYYWGPFILIGQE